MKAVILTRTGFHHTFFINNLQEKFEIACVVRETYPENRDEGILTSLFKKGGGLRRIRDSRYLKVFHEKNSAGFRYHPAMKDYLKSPFDVVIEKRGTKYLNVGCGEINSGMFAGFLAKMEPDIVVVLGSSVLGPHIISLPSVGAINLHSGLSPYYRGTWSYGWPIVNGEPEYIGATVHYIDPGIDTGDIIFQTKPALTRQDDLNSIFLKVIAEGTELVTRALETIVTKGRIAALRQPGGAGRHYRAKDFGADTARICLDNLRRGVIGDYLADREERDRKVILHGYVPPVRFR